MISHPAWQVPLRAIAQGAEYQAERQRKVAEYWYREVNDRAEAESPEYKAGYAAGRAVAAGNDSQIFRFIARALKAWLEDDFGSRKEPPTPMQARIHRDRTIAGLWIVEVAWKESGGFSVPLIASLSADPGHGILGVNRPAPERLLVQVPGGDYKPVEEVAEEDEEILSWMPIEMSGTPAAWPRKEDR